MSIEIRDVSFNYQFDPEEEIASAHVTGVSDITLNFPAGSCTLITGPSGSGKSTILKLLNGLIPTLYKGDLSGSTTLDGLDSATTDIQQLGRRAGTVFQNPRSQFFTANVLEELAFASENAGDDRLVTATRVADALAVWGIETLMRRKLRELSGGELQLVACAAAVAGPQRILLLDEPTSNLSPAAIGKFTSVLKSLKNDGWTLIIAEHRVYPLQEIADQVALLHDGKVVQLVRGAEFFAMSDDTRRTLGLRSLKRPHSSTLSKPADDPDTGITVKNLRFSYGKHQVLDIANLILPAGRVVALTGPNGAGKTTLARTLIGLANPQRGSEILFSGTPCNAVARQKRSVLVMQDVNRQLFAETVAAEVSLGNEQIAVERVSELLAGLGLAELAERHPMTLSGGQKQRLVIANALASEAQLYVFDEPTSGVDYLHLMSISAQIRSLAQAGKSVLVISHDLEFINEVADHQLQLTPLADSTEQLSWLSDDLSQD
ncbi:MAG: ABC transporter ATP-binding protein [Arcanobacterium sp.]|nr:ABC transporter ATP-binding protein [Arcanobacterium sp.]